ncbi:hypothetical protein [Testudinibacter sp. TR-2022]|uniref:hypothetical protein n=1 Tax=Testudinibacter sp. TR-2022 TaxID=2585029 RepID=UPI0011197464|nr:hypothetical protein [Testudinibacter sp. TR-2022]TNH06629.1 hypothetical protein FHQ30_07220 [Pasteurellaceae bacterium Phil11]TNH25534.1 hypothetical protein FHQ29_01305 [Testudinibacter sp. TR-2022]TNH25688.1 hypothetical protein FHQ27_08790 [Testudinibacter sp. TR-2022]
MTQQNGNRQDLFTIKPKLTPVEIHGKTFFIRELNVGETNKALYGQRAALLKLAQEQGIELNMEDELVLTMQLRNVYDPYTLARNIATRLCDENGKNLFNADSQDDLDQILTLDGSVLDAINKVLATEEPEKNSPNADDSN